MLKVAKISKALKVDRRDWYCFYSHRGGHYWDAFQGTEGRILQGGSRTDWREKYLTPKSDLKIVPNASGNWQKSRGINAHSKYDEAVSLSEK